jgi:peptidoglycan/xylan/chitin deacetylase (PgdA/CDA1 family)
MKNLPEIRCDDVLQISPASHNQVEQMKGMTLFEHFLEADKPFAKYNYPMILAIVAEGIEHYPEWVEYLKANKDRYVFELHGLRHINHSRLSVNQLRRDLETAKNMIEETFDTKVTTWYQPWGRKGEHKDMDCV